MKKIIILYFIIITPVSAQVTAPFGLAWGQSKSVVTAKGTQITGCTTIATGIESCRASNLPKEVSFGELYTLIFDSEKGLQKTLLAGVDITSDIYGREGKSKYNKLKNTFIKKYPSSEYKHSSFEWIARNLYKDSDEFYECLRYEGCGSWKLFVTGNGGVSVELKGSSRGTGYISLAHESPEWQDILGKAQSRKDESDMDSL